MLFATKYLLFALKKKINIYTYKLKNNQQIRVSKNDMQAEQILIDNFLNNEDFEIKKFT
jgi:hypothetical protein